MNKIKSLQYKFSTSFLSFSIEEHLDKNIDLFLEELVDFKTDIRWYLF